MPDLTEKAFEDAIEAALLAGGPDAPASALRERPVQGPFTPGGHHRRMQADYDRARVLIPKDLLTFVRSTQPQAWRKLRQQLGEQAGEELIRRVSKEVEKRGVLDVLRRGVKFYGVRLKMAYFRPASGLNPDLQRKYQGNIFGVIRQLHFSEKDEKSLDLVLFLNGLPIFTAELKNPFTGQNVTHAMAQYRKRRDPREPLFKFGRCLAHFAVDPDLVYFTTHLQKEKTRFFPFNKGWNRGAGNPPVLQGYRTSYLWEQIWARDSILDLIQNFIHTIDLYDKRGRVKGQAMIFPRYHQLDAVRRLVAEARAKGAGQRYLIQHSAGSGKSFTIAWLAHQLASLHDDQDRAVFDSVIIISDRRVIDRQLQDAVRQFEQVRGVVENIDKTSRQLREALQSGKKIIVTTLQKFPVIASEVRAMPGQRFAVLIDEAHSSQSGESVKEMKKVLSARTLEEAAAEEEREPTTMEDRIAAEMAARRQPPNVSFFAFTATPKEKTLELFGQPTPQGGYEPFSLYSMRQAIEEGFILDVLQNYTTYKTYWNLLKTIQEDPRYDRSKAAYLLRRFVDLHPHAIEKKTAIMVEHFADHVAHRIQGQAKAMVVTRSRLHAVRYKRAFDAYSREQGYPYKALVAFTGVVKDGGVEYTEAGMNGFPASQTAETFEQPEYRFLIVAEKFQTGFDQPLLHTMYVDRKLSGVHAVQTLSRLNRTHPHKEDTFVLDFANEAEAIQKAFAPYFDRTWLAEGTDPNLLYDLETRLEDFAVYTSDDLDAFARAYYDPKGTQAQAYAALDPVLERFQELEPEAQEDFKSALRRYARAYAFLAQILPFTDPDLEKLYAFSRYLLRRLPTSPDRLPVEVTEKIDLASFRVQKTFEGEIALPRGEGELAPRPEAGATLRPVEELEPLSAIIEELNQRFGTDFTEEDRIFIQHLEEQLFNDPVLENSAKVNDPENFRLTFDDAAQATVQEMMEMNFKFFKQINDNPEFAQTFFGFLFQRYLEQMQQRAA